MIPYLKMQADLKTPSLLIVTQDQILGPLISFQRYINQDNIKLRSHNAQTSIYILASKRIYN